jgi:hypothetical protein
VTPCVAASALRADSVTTGGVMSAMRRQVQPER